LLDRLLSFSLLAFAFACVSSATDVPTVGDTKPSGETVYVLAAGERIHPYAARAHWGSAAELAVALEEAGFVPTVVLDPSDVPKGAPVLEPMHRSNECFSHAYLPVLTVGIVPELGCRLYGHRLRLRCAGESASVELDASFKVRSYVGWFVWPLALWPNWVYDDAGPPDDRPEEMPLLRHVLQRGLAGARCAA
jgi:hypothetical protein